MLSAQVADATGRFAALHAWMAENLASDLRIEALAERANMTPRTFVRAYREHTGMTPAKSVELLRVESAKRLLVAQLDLGIATVAVRCGFIDQERMRRAFVRAIGVSPADYRSYFGRRRAAAQ